MATLTIRNLDEKVRRALRRQAAENDVSMEEQVRRILIRSVSPEAEAQRRSRREQRLEALHSLSEEPVGAFDLKVLSDEIWNARTL